LVAEKVLGWTEVKKVELNGSAAFQYLGVRPGEVPSKYTGYKPSYTIPQYSIDIAAAWEVVEKLKALVDDLEIEISSSSEYPEEWEVSVKYFKWCEGEEQQYGPFYFTEKTAAHAICLAALKTIGATFE
jgi:hypothetical protein